MRIAIAQINPTLFDFDTNSQKILEQAQRAKSLHCDLIVFPECSLFGYHPFDLLEISELVAKQDHYLEKIQRLLPAGLGALIGTIRPSDLARGKPYYNSAVFIEKGKKAQFFNKELLPTGDVFDEARFIESGKIEDGIFRFHGKKILVTICEDIWAWPDEKGRSRYHENPLKRIARKHKKFDLILNLSASPFDPDKNRMRTELVAKTSRLFKAPMFYVNMVGAQDEIIFDGQSFALDAKGRELARLMPFEEDFGVVDLEKMEGMIRPEKFSTIEQTRRALILGIRDFCAKTGLSRVHFGLSGGVDSALVACLAVDALGPSQVSGFALPTEFNSPDSLRLAQELAQNLGIHLQTVSIQEPFDSLRRMLDSAFQIQEFGLVHENLQARLRALILMAHSNLTGSLLLSTSNKSEAAAGYTTLYGDMCGGLMPIADLTKNQVYEMAKLYNLQHEVIPDLILTRPPSAELRPNQKDQDSLPPYDLLDQAVNELVVEGKVGSKPAEKFLLAALLKSEFKRWQAPPILKVSRHAFGRGRRWPVAHHGQKMLLAKGSGRTARPLRSKP